MKNKKNILLFVIILLVLLCACARQDEPLFVSEYDGASFVDGNQMEEQEKPKDQLSENQEKNDDIEVETGTNTKTECYVHVCGAVSKPGVYVMLRGARIFEAIEKAGGITENAYDECINQALLVTDGMQIRVPTMEEWEKGQVTAENYSFAEQVGNDGSHSFHEDGDEDGLVNINSADASRLCTIPGIGETRAEAIISYRETHGSFQKIEDIQNVTGIKEGLFNQIKDKIKI